MLKQIISGLLVSAAWAGAVSAQGQAGAYLAAKSANIANDYVEAAYYYNRLATFDPENGFLLQGAMVTSIAAGDFATGVEVAQMMADAGFEDGYAQTVLIASAFSEGDFDRVSDLLEDDRFDVNPLIKMLIKGWVLVAQNDLAAASAHFSTPAESGAVNSFANYHNALAMALSGDYAGADQILSKDGAYVNRGSILAHVEILALLGKREAALSLLSTGAGGALIDRDADALRNALNAGEEIVFSQISQPSDAVSEVFLVLADALNTENSERLALFFARMAQANQPQATEALLLIAEILSTQNQHELAISAYAQIAADDPFALNAAIGRAAALQRFGDADTAIDVLQDLTISHADNLTAWRALGDALRRESRYALAREAYSTAIDLLPDPNLPGAWRLYYTRAITAERLSDWPDADWNFRQALALNPDQPDVLNYLGYSLVERGEKLDEALEMIQTAATARPDSGFIADSLGWVYYRLGRFEEAVPVMENAVLLLPVDAVVNDHLGDVLWQVNRKREARFQWRRALSFDPSEIDAARIRKKLAIGLDAVLEAESGASAD